MKKILFLLLLITCTCVSQKGIISNGDTSLVCWGAPLGYDSIELSYIVYYREYQGGDTNWHVLGTSDSLSILINKLGHKNYILGVRSVYDNGNKLSDMCTSLDSNACFLSENCDDPCLEIGPWYLSWKLGKPVMIRVINY